MLIKAISQLVVRKEEYSNMIIFSDALYFNPKNGSTIFIATLKEKKIFKLPIRYANTCEQLQNGCDRNSIDKDLLELFDACSVIEDIQQ